MATILTLKNIPDAVYERLKASAEAHRRSLNSEAIVCLEAALIPTLALGVKVVTLDSKLLRAFPQYTVSLAVPEGFTWRH